LGWQHAVSFCGSKICAVKARGLRPGCCKARLNIRKYSWLAGSLDTWGSLAGVPEPEAAPVQPSCAPPLEAESLLMIGPEMPRQSASIAASIWALRNKLKISSSLSFSAFRCGRGSDGCEALPPYGEL